MGLFDRHANPPRPPIRRQMRSTRSRSVFVPANHSARSAASGIPRRSHDVAASAGSRTRSDASRASSAAVSSRLVGSACGHCFLRRCAHCATHCGLVRLSASRFMTDTVCPYSIGRKGMSTDESIDGVELELICLCGFENFERVVVQRKPHSPIVTDFVACVGCRAMYFAPLAPAALPASPVLIGSSAGPQPNYKGPLFGPRSDSTPTRAMTPEEQARLEAAVARVNKGKD
jgi:hypothetical protein